MKKNAILLSSVFLLAIARVAMAQDACSDSDQMDECWLKIYQGTNAENVTAAAAKDELAKKTTGADSFASGLSSTIKNFLPLFSGLIESQTISEDGNALTLDFNVPFLDSGKGRNLQAQGVLRKPVLSEEIKKAFPEMVRAARVEDLEKELDDFDDASLVLSYNIVTNRTGRSFEQHRPLYSALFGALAKGVPDDTPTALLQLGTLLQSNEDIFLDTTGTQKFESIPDEGMRKLAKSLIERSARDAAANRTALEAAVVAKGLDVFADLLNNQPQFYASAVYRSRQDLVGSDEVTAKLTYEKGFFNVNTLRGKLGANCLVDSGEAPPECLAKYAIWINDNRNRIKAGERLALSIEYAEEDALSFQQPTDHVDLRLPTSHKLMASFSYGRYLTFTTNDQNTRLDISAQYEDFSEDATKRDRGVGSITLTRKISDSMSLPLGLVYANHGKFLGDVDEELSAHFGLKFKMPGQNN